MKRIVIASVLKPVTDVRMYERFAISMAKTNKYEINIIGIPSKKKSAFPNIIFHPIPDSRRKWPVRMLNVFRMLSRCITLKPSLIILTTPELLPIVPMLKLTGSYIIYDVREDYWKNLRHQQVYPFPLSQFLSIMVRGIERLISPIIDHFFFAELCYEEDLPFGKNRSTILENKVVQTDINPTTKPDHFTCLFTGTLSEYSGIFRAIEFFKRLKEIKPEAHLHIIGYAPSGSVLKRLENEINNHDSIQLTGGYYPVEHEEIVHAITYGDLGIVGYQPNAVNRKRMPTKVFEYCYYGLPFVIEDNTYWYERAKDIGGHPIPLSYDQPEGYLTEIKRTLEMRREKKTHLDQAAWESDQNRLLNTIESLLSRA